MQAARDAERGPAFSRPFCRHLWKVRRVARAVPPPPRAAAAPLPGSGAAERAARVLVPAKAAENRGGSAGSVVPVPPRPCLVPPRPCAPSAPHRLYAHTNARAAPGKRRKTQKRRGRMSRWRWPSRLAAAAGESQSSKVCVVFHVFLFRIDNSKGGVNGTGSHYCCVKAFYELLYSCSLFSTPSMAFPVLFPCLLHWVSPGGLDCSAGVLGVAISSAFSEGLWKCAMESALFSPEKHSIYDHPCLQVF